MLDSYHYGLESVKERILDFLAVRTLCSMRPFSILVVDDEPVARTNLEYVLRKEGYEVVAVENGAKALGRKFTRLSMAGMRDEAELRGHRLTYVSAMPGRIINEIRRLGVRIIPRQLAAKGLTLDPPQFTDEALVKIIHEYTEESGVRNLEREIATVCRKLARERIGKNGAEELTTKVTTEGVENYWDPGNIREKPSMPAIGWELPPVWFGLILGAK